MKKVSCLITVLISIGLSHSHGQSLQNTHWKSLFKEPINDTATLNIGLDSSNITNRRGVQIVRSFFLISHDTVSIKDIGGEIACGEELGFYTFTITGDVLKFKLITDPCSGRGESLDGRAWIRTGK